MNRRRAENVNVRAETLLHAQTFDDAAARLDQELATLSLPALLEAACGTVKILPGEVVEHDNVCAGCNRLVGLGFRLTFDRDKKGKASCSAESLDRFGDGA